MTRAAQLTLLFAALTVVMAAPWSLHPTTRILVDNPDAHLFMWTLGWDAHAFISQPLSIFDANIYHPLPNTLAYSENLIGSAMLVAPIVWATNDLLLALNLASMLACGLSGIGAYVLGRKVGLSPASAIITGIVFAFAPSRFFRMSQMHVNAMQWMPFGLAYLHAYFDRGRARDLRIALGFLVMQAITVGHGAVFLGVAMLALAAYRLARGEPLAPLRRLRDVGLIGAMLTVPAILIWLPYRRAQEEMGLRRSLENWTVTPESFFASPTHVHQFVMSLLTDRNLNETASAFLFPSYLVLLLGIVALWPARGAGNAEPDATPNIRRNVVFYGLLAGLSVLFFIDGPLSLWPWVYSWPGFSFIRVPSRFMILTTLTLAVLAGAGFERLAARATGRGMLVGATLLAAALLGEFATQPFSGTPYAIRIPSIVRWLDTLPKPFVVAEVPVPRARTAGAYVRFNTAAMLHSTVHWQKTIHGYSGLEPALHARVLGELNLFPNEASIASLKELGVTHVVVHRPLYAPDEWPDVESRLRQSVDLRFVHAEADGEVYEILK